MKDTKDNEPPISKYLNPDWIQASKHGLASKIGISNQDNLIFCTCCFHHINKDPIPLSQNVKQLQFLGHGVPLYFVFVRYCIFLLLFMIFSYNLPSLYFALTHNQQFCNTNIDEALPPSFPTLIMPDNQKQIHSHSLRSHVKYIHHTSQITAQTQHQISQQQAVHQIQCTGWMIYLSRIQKKVTIQEQLIRFSSFFIHLILLIYIRDRLTKMKYYFDQRSASPSDFTVFIKNMPPRTGQKNLLQKTLKQFYNANPRQIILIPDLKSYLQMEVYQKSLIHNLQKLIQKHKQPNKQIRDLQNEIKINQKNIKQLIIKDKQKYLNDQIEAERAVVIFNTQDQKWLLISNFKQNPISQKGWQNVEMSQASQPLQIIWENSCYNHTDKKFFKFLGWFLSILTLVIITGIFIVISHQKSRLVEQKIVQYKKNINKDPHLLRQAFFLVLGMIFLVVLFNKFVLAHLFHKFTELQKHSSTYKFQFYFCLKYCLGLFFTTALMTLIIQDFIFQNFFKHNFGVIEQETIMFLFNSTFVPLFWLINPVYLLRKYKRWRNYGSKYLTQQQANILMQDPAYDVGKRYGQVVEIMWFTFLYMTIVPVGGLFSCIGLIAYYWIDKYNLLRRSTIHGLISGDLIDLTLKMLQFTLPLRAAGSILFDYQIRDGISLISWIYLGISIILILLPIQRLVNIFNYEKFFNQRLNYEEAEKLFKHTYKNVNILFNRLDQDRSLILKEKTEKKRNQQLVKQQLILQNRMKNKQTSKVMNNI